MLGTVTNIKEAVQWLSYTYMYCRMVKNPLVYGLTYKAGDGCNQWQVVVWRGEETVCALGFDKSSTRVKRGRDLCSPKGYCLPLMDRVHVSVRISRMAMSSGIMA